MFFIRFSCRWDCYLLSLTSTVIIDGNIFHEKYVSLTQFFVFFTPQEVSEPSRWIWKPLLWTSLTSFWMLPPKSCCETLWPTKCYQSSSLVLTRYTELMYGIIDASEDVKLLRELSIVSNHLNNDDKVVELFYNSTMQLLIFKENIEWIFCYLFNNWKKNIFQPKKQLLNSKGKK